MEKKKINVVQYDSNWPKIFKMQAEEIKKALGENVIKIHHVGSTSVPGLCAKPTIDIMCVVKDLKTVTKPLEGIGYMGKGELNLPLRMFFKKKTPNDINIQVLEETKNILKDWISNYNKNDYYRWAITLKNTGELVGGIDIILIL